MKPKTKAVLLIGGVFIILALCVEMFTSFIELVFLMLDTDADWSNKVMYLLIILTTTWVYALNFLIGVAVKVTISAVKYWRENKCIKN